MKEDTAIKQSEEGLNRTFGFVALYVDDVLAVGQKKVMSNFLEEVQRTWKCSRPEWVEEDQWSKFCGYELAKKGDTFLLSQRSYVKDLLGRYEDLVPKATPLPGNLDKTLEEDVQIADVRADSGRGTSMGGLQIEAGSELCNFLAWSTCDQMSKASSFTEQAHFGLLERNGRHELGV